MDIITFKENPMAYFDKVFIYWLLGFSFIFEMAL